MITAARFFAGPGGDSVELEDRFFTDLKTRNATFKRTATDRFGDLDDVCIRCFAAAETSIRDVLDIGISSGGATLALSERLHKAGYDAAVTGTDLSLTAHIVPVLPGVRALVDDAGFPLQHDVLGLAVRPWRRRADYLTGMLFVRNLLNRIAGNRARRELQRGTDQVRSVRLVSPRLANDRRVSVEQNDILVPTEQYRNRFNFVRVANVLNRDYFNEPDLRRALHNCVSYLSGPGAWLLVVRSTGGHHVATLFQVSADGRRLTAVDRFGGGSEVEWLVFQTPLPGEWAR
ncbi:hypothetical protein [Sphingomonas aerophila]|uniref:Uncharacterized protein n=1 Tax=Sphingomonas aerophila TaxID=1344948 RepID=A0A7W9BBT1_9SPHN|nr:hypothetical protein [Sphingomonas aerophila]